MWRIVVPVLVSVFAAGLCSPPGGFQDANRNDPDFQNALRFAVATHNRGNTGDSALRQVVYILSAQVQTVAGYNYVIVVNLGRTNCNKGSPNTGCTVYTNPAQAQIYECTFTVWTAPWLNDIQLTGEKCWKP